jgi:hypothetical protein
MSDQRANYPFVDVSGYYKGLTVPKLSSLCLQAVITSFQKYDMDLSKLSGDAVREVFKGAVEFDGLSSVLISKFKYSSLSSVEVPFFQSDILWLNSNNL